MTFSRAAAVTLLTAALSCAACDEPLSDLTGPTPNLEPTFSSISRDIFQSTDAAGRLACTQCHTSTGGRTPPVGLSLDPAVAYDNLVGRTSVQRPGIMRVAPGDPESSYLVHKLEGSSGIVGARMPRTNGPFLTEGQMLVIKRWIANGARND